MRLNTLLNLRLVAIENLLFSPYGNVLIFFSLCPDLGVHSTVMFRDFTIQDPKTKKEIPFIRKWKFLISPFCHSNVTPFSYDLAIGNQYYSLGDIERRGRPLNKDHPYNIKPRETIIVLTKEEIALPPYYSATIWPRFNHVREGIFQSMVKIDPTWRGNIAVAITNVSPAVYPIETGQKFATLILYELTRESQYTLRHTSKIEPLIQYIPTNLIQEYTSSEINEKIDEKGLKEFCKCDEDDKGRYLIFKHMELKESNLEKLIRIFKDNKCWGKFVEEAFDQVVKNPFKGMEAYGLENLDLIIGGIPKGKRITSKNIEEGKKACTKEDFEKTAIEFGGPCEFLPIIPEFTIKQVEENLVPRIKAEIRADLFPRLVTLTLTVLGMLSLIAAVIALLLGRFPKKSPIPGVDWPGTIAWVAVVIGILTLIVFLSLFGFNFLLEPFYKIVNFIKEWEVRQIPKMKKDIDDMKKQIKELQEKAKIK